MRPPGTAVVWNPATGQEQAHVLLAEPSDVDAAVQAAAKAFDDWRDVGVAAPAPGSCSRCAS